MSTLKTHNLQSPDAGSVNIAMTPNAGMIVAGISTFTGAIDANGDLDVDGHTNLDNVSVAGITTFSNATTIVNGGYHRGIINSGAQAKIIGGYISGSDTLRLGESMYLTSTGLGINESSPPQRLTIGGDIQIGFNTPNDAGRQLNFNVNRGSAGQTLANINWQWNSKFVAQIRGIAGSDTTNKDDAHLAFFTSSANNLGEKLRITSAGNIGVGNDNPGAHVHIDGGTSGTQQLRVQNHSSIGSFDGNYGSEFRHATSASNHAMLIHCHEAQDNRRTLDISSQNGIFASFTNGKFGLGTVGPKSKMHVTNSSDVRIGGQYGGMASFQHQMEYSSGYTGTHWMFETNGMHAWSFDGVLIVYGSGGSSYGCEVTNIKIVYARESGALNSGDTWRNGSSDYNVETLGHGQVGLNPSAGSLSVTEQTNPDGAASQRSLLKLGWSASGQSVGVWSQLIGNIYWGANGSVEIQDKDGNIKFNSNP